MMTEKEKKRWPVVPFPFHPSLLTGWPNAEGVGRICTSKWIKHSSVHFVKRFLSFKCICRYMLWNTNVQFWWFCLKLKWACILLLIWLALLWYSFFKLKYGWFTMFCQFLLYSRVTQSYTHIHSFSSNYFPPYSIPRDWIEFPVLYSRTSLLIHSKCNNLHLLTPNSQPIPLPPSPPFGNHKSVLCVRESVLVL